MHSRALRRWVICILALSLVMRLGFLFFGDVLPVMWDARRYAAAALGIISFFDASGPEGAEDARRDRHRFHHYYDKYIHGEQIQWLFYSPHTLTQAREDLFYGGPLYPAILAVVFLASPWEDFTVARLLNVLFDLLSNLLLIYIGVRLVGRGPALIAGLLYAVYFPFLLASSMLLLETSTSLGLLMALYLLLRASETQSRRYLVWSGVLTGLLVLHKPTAILLAVPLSAGLYIYNRHRWSLRALAKQLRFYLAPVIVIGAAWFVIASVFYGRPALRDPVYVSANLRQSSSIPFEGYDLDKVERDFWTRSVAEDILADPIGYAGLLAKKLDRLWRRPFNDFKRSFIMPYRVGEWFHLWCVVAGLMGIVLLLRAGGGKVGWPVLIIGYYTAIHLVFHSLSRYNFNAMPMLLLGTAYFVYRWITCFRDGTTTDRRALVVGVAAVLLAWVIPVDGINTLLAVGLSLGLVIAMLGVKTIALGAGLWLLTGVSEKPLGRLGKLLAVAVPLFLLTVPGWTTTLARHAWGEYSCRLDDPQMKAGIRLYVSDLQPVPEGEILAVVADVNSGEGRTNTFTVNIGDSTREFVGGRSPLVELFYPKPAYRFFAQYEPLAIEAFRQYAIIPISDSLIRHYLDSRGCLDVWLAINEAFQEENNYITLWGNHGSGGGEAFIPGIRFTSLERHVHENDPRIPYPVNLLSDSVLSYYIPRGDTAMRVVDDLSPAPGKQSGRYNIFLIHFRADGSFVVY